MKCVARLKFNDSVSSIGLIKLMLQHQITNHDKSKAHLWHLLSVSLLYILFFIDTFV